MSSRPDPRVLLRLLGLLAPYRWRLALAALALLAASGSVLLLGQGLRLVVDRGFMAADSAALGQALGLMLGVVTVLALASALRYYLVTWIGERLAADLRRRVFDHLLTLEPGFFESAQAPGQAAGEITSRLTADTSVLQSLFGSSVSLALRNLLMLIGAVALMLVTQPWLSAIVLLGIPATVLPILWFGRRVRRLSRASQDRVAELGRYADEALSGIRTVQAFTHEGLDRRDYAGRVEEAFASAIERTRQRAWLTGIAMLAVFAAVGIMLWQGGQAVLAGTMTAGELSAFVFYAVLAAGAVATLAEVAGDVQRAAGAAERLLELLDTRPAIAPPAHPVPLPEPLAGELRFEGVRFTYPGQPVGEEEVERHARHHQGGDVDAGMDGAQQDGHQYDGEAQQADQVDGQHPVGHRRPAPHRQRYGQAGGHGGQASDEQGGEVPPEPQHAVVRHGEGQEEPGDQAQCQAQLAGVVCQDRALEQCLQCRVPELRLPVQQTCFSDQLPHARCLAYRARHEHRGLIAWLSGAAWP